MMKTGDYQIYVNRFADDPGVAGTYFEHVSGRTFVRDLSPCLGAFNQGGTCILPVNIEGPASGFIVQMAYCQMAGDSKEYFYYVMSNSATAIKWPLSWTPQLGLEYRFEVTRGATVGQPGKIIFKLIKTATGTSQTLVLTHSWSDDLDHAWWGGETLGDESAHGTYENQAGSATFYMQYQTETGSLTQRSNMSGVDGGDVSFATGTPVDRHGHIENGNVPGSVLNIFTQN